MAQDWLTLLLALEQTAPANGPAGGADLLLRLDIRRLGAAGEDALIELTQRVRWWSRVLASRGVAALLEAATTDERVPERLLR